MRIEGGRKVEDKFADPLPLGSGEQVYEARRALAELGIGSNPSAKQPDNVLEAEKTKGTVHACHCADLKSKIALSRVVDLKEVGTALTLEY